MLPSELIATARFLLAQNQGSKPRQATLRRAVSTAYYAMFHCLARSCADLLVGSTGAVRSEPAWLQVYRSLNHGSARKACENKLMETFPAAIQDFATMFMTLQEKRHKADYDPSERFTRDGVNEDVRQAEQAIALFSQSKLGSRLITSSRS